MTTPTANERTVNRALAKAGVPVKVWKYGGGFAITTIDPEGPWVESVAVCHWHHLSIEQWVEAVTFNYQAALDRFA